MSNRYTRTGYTARQVDQLMKMRTTILNILSDRSSKNDSPKAFQYLLSASDRILFALDESEAWKRGEE